MSDEAVEIVRAVAAEDPLYETRMLDRLCLFCDGDVEGPRIVSRDPIEWGPQDVENHEGDCAWRRAVEFVRAIEGGR